MHIKMNEKCLKKWLIDKKSLWLVVQSHKQENVNFFPECVCNDLFLSDPSPIIGYACQ